MGDFDREMVPNEQLEALDELIDYLEAKVGVLQLTTHRQLERRPTSCPGRYFPEYVLLDD